MFDESTTEIAHILTDSHNPNPTVEDVLSWERDAILAMAKIAEADQASHDVVTMRPADYQVQLNVRLEKNQQFARDRESLRQRIGEVVRNHVSAVRFIQFLPHLAPTAPARANIAADGLGGASASNARFT